MSDFAEIKKRRDEIRAKWEASGFLAGLTGMANEKIVEKFQCCTNSKLKIKDMLNLTEIKKDLYRSKAMATFSHYVSGNLYYVVSIFDSKYLFPVATVEDGPVSVSEDCGEHMISTRDCATIVQHTYLLSSDLGTTAFLSEIKGSELIRWIGKALERDELTKVG